MLHAHMDIDNDLTANKVEKLSTVIVVIHRTDHSLQPVVIFSPAAIRVVVFML